MAQSGHELDGIAVNVTEALGKLQNGEHKLTIRAAVLRDYSETDLHNVVDKLNYLLEEFKATCEKQVEKQSGLRCLEILETGVLRTYQDLWAPFQ
jgi:hypothetical protein